MQDNLDRLQQWSRDLLLSFYPDKCCVLKLGSHQSEATYFIKGTTSDGEGFCVALAESDVQKDLGALIDNKLSLLRPT